MKSKPVALVSGITGQDGSYLAELLLEKGYDVHGIVRRSSSFNRERIEHLHSIEGNGLILHYGDMVDSSNLGRILKEVCPDEIYHLAAQSHVAISFEVPEYTADADGVGTLRLLEAVRFLEMGGSTKIYNASTSELFGFVEQTPQNESTPFHPCSPYAVAKLYSHWICKIYREAYGMSIWNGILFNHCGPRRGENFITRKITMSIAKILSGKQSKIVLGNLNAKRDWGYVIDYVHAMYLMLQQVRPDDFVIATGVTHSVREFVELAFRFIGININWVGYGVNEKGINKNTGKVLVEISPKYFRPTDVNFLLGDPSKAKRILGWKPTVGFEELVKIMMKADLEKEGVKLPCALKN